MRSTRRSTPRAGLDRLATYPFHDRLVGRGRRLPGLGRRPGDGRSGGRSATFAPPAGLTVPTDREVSPDRIAHPTAARLRLRRAPPRDGVGPRDAGIRAGPMAAS